MASTTAAAFYFSEEKDHRDHDSHGDGEEEDDIDVGEHGGLHHELAHGRTLSHGLTLRGSEGHAAPVMEIAAHDGHLILK